MASVMLDSSGSEDEFPDVKEIVRRHKSSNTTTTTTSKSTKSSSSTSTSKNPLSPPRLLARDNDKENLFPPPSPKLQLKPTSMSPQKTQATPGVRRRKLGMAQSQAVDGSLFQRWDGAGAGAGAAAEPQTARKMGSRARMIREASVATTSTSTSAFADNNNDSSYNNTTIGNHSIMSFGSTATASTSTSKTSRQLFRKKSRPRLQIDDSFDECDEDEDDAVVSRRKARSVRPPTRFRDMLRAARPTSGLDDDDDSEENDSSGAFGKSSAGEAEDSEFDSFGQRSRGADSTRSTFNSELFTTPPKRRAAKAPGTARRVLRPAKTAASVDPMMGRKEPATSRKPSRTVSTKDAGKTPGNGKASKSKEGGLEDAFQKLQM